MYNEQAQICCTDEPCNFTLPPLSEVYPEALRVYNYQPPLFQKHLAELNNIMRSKMSCWPGLYVCFLPLIGPLVGCALCFKACKDGEIALRMMDEQIININNELAGYGILLSWVHEEEKSSRESRDENGNVQHHEDVTHFFRIRPTNPVMQHLHYDANSMTQPPPSMVMHPATILSQPQPQPQPTSPYMVQAPSHAPVLGYPVVQYDHQNNPNGRNTGQTPLHGTTTYASSPTV